MRGSRASPAAPLVLAAGRDARVPESIHLRARLRLETPMAAVGVFRLRSLADREVDPIRMRRARPPAVAEPVIAAADLDDFERLHDRIIEALGRGNV